MNLNCVNFKRFSNKNTVQQLSIGKVGAILVAIPASCLAIVLLVLMDFRREEALLRENTKNIEARIFYSTQVLQYIVDYETGVRGYLLTRNQQFLEPYYESKRRLPYALAALEQDAPAEASILPVLKAQIEQRFIITETLLATEQPAILASPQLFQQLERAKTITDQIRQTITSFKQQQRALLQQQQQQIQQRAQQIDQVQIIGAVLSVLTYTAVVYLFQILNQQIIKRRQEVQELSVTNKSLTDTLVEGVILLDQRGIIESLNPAAEKILGYQSPSLRGRALVHVLFPANNVEPTSLVNAAAWVEARIATRQLEQMEIYRHDGHTVPIELSISRIPSERPQLITLIRDVSDRVQLTDTLAEKVKELAKTNFALRHSKQALESFVQASAHDLKTPLRGVASLAQWIESDLEAQIDVDTQAHFELLHRRVRRMQAIIDGLLSYSRIDTWIAQTQIVNVDLLLQEVCQAIPVPDKFEVRVEKPMPILQTSYLALKLVFEQLIRNAIEHHDSDHGCITIMATPQSDNIDFCVCDDGPGIEPAYRERVLKMFQVLKHQADSTNNIGIGLALVGKTIDLIGGTLELGSVNDGRGLAVHFSWPRQDSN